MFDDLTTSAGEAIRDGAAWLWDALMWVLGALSVGMFVIVCCCALAYIVAGIRAGLRDHAAARARAYRDWCDTHQWCSQHDRPDGQCPRIQIEVVTGFYPSTGSPRFASCPGSERYR